MFCTNCGATIEENTRFCYKCGAKVIPIPEQQEVQQIQYQPQFQYQEQKMYKSAIDGRVTNKKESTLSVVAAVLSLFTITIFFGVICALIDLLRNDIEHRHAGSVFALVYSLFVIVAYIMLK